jgi:hypothetical protein
MDNVLPGLPQKIQTTSQEMHILRQHSQTKSIVQEKNF